MFSAGSVSPVEPLPFFLMRLNPQFTCLSRALLLTLELFSILGLLHCLIIVIVAAVNASPADTIVAVIVFGAGEPTI